MCTRTHCHTAFAQRSFSSFLQLRCLIFLMCNVGFQADEHIIILRPQESLLLVMLHCIDSHHANKKGEHTRTHCHTALFTLGKEICLLSAARIEPATTMALE